MHGCGKKWYPGGALEEARLLPSRRNLCAC
jgi:hypothetical protein